MFKIIQRNALKGTHLPVTVKEIKTGNLNNPCFKDLYLCLAQNTLTSSKDAMKRGEALAVRYLSLD